MSFPTTPILDNFNRPDCGPPPGADWLNDIDTVQPGLIVDTTQCAGSSPVDLNLSYWATQIEPDCEVYVTISTACGPLDSEWLGWRISMPDWSNLDGYIMYVNHALNEITVEARVGGGPASSITFSQAVNDGDSIGISMVGDVVTVYYRPVGGAWGALGTFTDDTYATAGYLMLGVNGNTGRLDNFGGGRRSLLLTCNHYCELSDVEGLLKRDFSETDPDLTEALIESYICMRAGEIDAARQAGAQTATLSAGGAQYLKYLNMIGAASLIDLSCRGGMSNAAEFPTRAWWVEEFRQGLEKIRLSQIIITQSGTGADYPACGTAERGWTPFADLRIMRNRGG